MTDSAHLPEWPATHPGTRVSARLKQTAEDFVVEEQLGFEPSGEGNHLCLWVEKRGLNTQDVVRHLARQCRVKPMAIGVAGQKDRQAVTRQWFTVALDNRPAPEADALHTDAIRILQTTRHNKKLKRGVHQGNRFLIRLTDIAEPSMCETRLAAIRAQGFPNYFGMQRFGREGNNLVRARSWFAGEIQIGSRQQRSFCLSAARSFLFNQVLAERVRNGSWNRLLAGDDVRAAGAQRSVRQPYDLDHVTQQIDSGELHPTGPLWGQGDLATTDAALDLERAILQQEPQLCEGLAAAGLKQERRPLRAMPQAFTWALEPNALRLDFTLPAGYFATALLQELAELV